MAYGDDPTKVSLETFLDDDELTMDEFATDKRTNYEIERKYVF